MSKAARTIVLDGVAFRLRSIWYELEPTAPAPQPGELLASVIGKGTRVGTVYHIVSCRRIKSLRYCRYQLGLVAAPELASVATIGPGGISVRDVKAHPLYWLPRRRP
ncbi:hypothetical protein ACFPAF_16495 [Hymenobacter endophyticus]|uniref:Uncharacterized protein n=1 Tax=Hymenobacter endophyticus TaxID=3076335 RepID=A0ABU3TKV8_9BACT|nr:hypothetical protein [Hymenobacter endophyticus]MDU0372003.1 hypothetical protein [Hymenobacter endophyticus]